ncbi:hypothetical protein [Cellvibrio sp. PSBB006]|uniref:hypothetical protein n=1 Tax=Cellvibrio sp. PSBB006 TaxID=1987723 RepID=UPI0012F77099|nr:hypothetical protein [Cellvibrio sp. PSBB006]
MFRLLTLRFSPIRAGLSDFPFGRLSNRAAIFLICLINLLLSLLRFPLPRLILHLTHFGAGNGAFKYIAKLTLKTPMSTLSYVIDNVDIAMIASQTGGTGNINKGSDSGSGW